MILKVDRGTALAEQLLTFVEGCSWAEAKEHIAGMIRDWAFTDWETMFAAVIGGRIAGMASAMRTDYYPLPDICPWVSCIFVDEEYRGHRLSGELIAAANGYLKRQGFARSYIPSEFSGLYEKYGYTHLRDIVNYGGGTDRLYVKELGPNAAAEPARREDLKACADVIQRSFMTVADRFGFTKENAPRFTAFAVTEEKLARQLEKGLKMTVLRSESGRIIGYYSLAPKEDGTCELGNLCVLPEYRRSGYGELLLNDAREKARAAGRKAITIGIVEENTALGQWYEKAGFIHTGTEKFDFFPFTCGYMRLEL